MDTYSDNFTFESSVPATATGGTRSLPSWCSFIMGGALTFLFVYIGIARPAAHEMAMMRRQMKTLEQSVWEVAGHKNTAGDTNKLLGLLAKQRRYAVEAEASLRQIQQLHRQLVGEAGESHSALATVEQLVEIKDSVLDGSNMSREAAEVLQASEYLHQRLAESAETMSDARRASEQLLAIESDLLESATDVGQAQDTLGTLLQLGQDLEIRGGNVSTARDQVNGLLALKDTIISQTANLADAVETLELTAELGTQFHETAVSFDRIRHWMLEIVTMEPMMQRAQRVLEPLTELGNLRRLDPEQLRSVARAVSRDYRTQVARKPDAPAVEFSSNDLDTATHGIYPTSATETMSLD